MDGLDIACVSFSKGSKWTFELLKCKSYHYDGEMRDRLTRVASENLDQQKEVDHLFGEWIAKRLLEFGIENIDLIAVHGHTIVHKPKDGVSWQLGDGGRIADLVKTTVISDFRSLDVSIGGEGAPLVPMGDFELLSRYDACLNLGGIANVSVYGKRIAWDICPCNQVLNFFANKLGKDFDENGQMAREGKIDSHWEQIIASDPFYTLGPPKSLPNQFISSDALDSITPLDGLSTYTKFLSERIVEDISQYLPAGSIITTGGGAFNSFLVETLNNKMNELNFIVPDSDLVEYKEAIVFGFLGVLRLRNEPNVLASVTGASRDTSSGIIHYPK